jgi:hypothetical protein
LPPLAPSVYGPRGTEATGTSRSSSSARERLVAAGFPPTRIGGQHSQGFLRWLFDVVVAAVLSLAVLGWRRAGLHRRKALLCS